MVVRREPLLEPKKPGENHISFGFVRVHSDDFDSLLRFVKPKVGVIRIANPLGLEIDEGADLAQLTPAEKRSLQIVTARPEIRIRFDGLPGVWTSDDAALPFAQQTAAHIRNYRMNSAAYLLRRGWWWYAINLMPTAIVALGYLPRTQEPLVWVLLAVALASAGLLIGHWSLTHVRAGGANVEGATRSQRAADRSGTKSQTVAAVVGAIAGFIGTVLVGQLLPT